MSNAFFSIGSALGKAGAYAVHGTRVGSTQLAAGARSGYATKSEELIARRKQLQAIAEDLGAQASSH